MASLVDILVENRRLQTDEAFAAYENALRELIEAPKNPLLLSDLLLAFCDSVAPLDVEDHTMMWSLVYYVESFEIVYYIDSLIKVTPTLLLDAKQWLEILYVAILNSDDYKILKVALQQASKEAQEAVRLIFGYILFDPFSDEYTGRPC